MVELYAPEGGRFMPVDSPASAPTQYGSFAPTPKRYRIALDTARDKERFSIGGSFLWAFNASSITALMQVGFNTENSDLFSVKWGFALKGLKFSELYITNTAQAGEYIELMIVDQGQYLNSLNPVNVTNTVEVVKPTGLGTVADVTVVAAAAAAVCLAANSNRRTALITSLPTNTQVVRVGDSNVGASRGEYLSPGDSVSFDTTDAIYAYTAAGSNQTLAISYTED